MHLFLVASFAPSSKALVSNSFLLLLVRHLLLVAMHLFLVASFAPSSKALVSNSFVTTSKALVTSSDALVPSSVLCSEW